MLHSPQPAFATSEGLRVLLIRLHDAGPGAWRSDPEAAALMQYTIRKYAGLARKHRQEPEDAAPAAFDAMRSSSVRGADDPWAVVTRAVDITLKADEQAAGMLCSTHQARRAEYSGFHEAERFSDRETSITEYHPAFRVEAPDDTEDESDDRSEQARRALEETIALFVALDWPEDVTRAAIEYLSGRLIETGSRRAAYESLRRDKHARALLDLPRVSWTMLLRVVLGSPDPTLAATNTGRGVLLRLTRGYPVAEIAADDDLALTIILANPITVRGGELS